MTKVTYFFTFQMYLFEDFKKNIQPSQKKEGRCIYFATQIFPDIVNVLIPPSHKIKTYRAVILKFYTL